MSNCDKNVWIRWKYASLHWLIMLIFLRKVLEQSYRRSVNIFLLFYSQWMSNLKTFDFWNFLFSICIFEKWFYQNLCYHLELFSRTNVSKCLKNTKLFWQSSWTNVAACNNRDHTPRSLYDCLFAPWIWVLFFVHITFAVRGESHNQRHVSRVVATQFPLEKN